MDSTPSTPPPKPENTITPFPYANLLDGPFDADDFRERLRTDGYAVIPCMSRERALDLRQQAFGWLERWGLDRNDPTTWDQSRMPLFTKGGMFGGNQIGQEQFVWDIRTEPGVIAIFEKLWGTEKLVCSFDGGSLMLPGITTKAGDPTSWQHIDMCPSRVGFFCAQGLVNLNDNGPEDGGLVVMKGSSLLQKKFFDIHGRPPIPDERLDWHMFSDEDKAWFEQQGCEWLKVDAKAGDMILWDSATMHQNRPPSGKNDRMVTYVCMAPADLMTEQDKKVRVKAFKELRGSTHTPVHGCHSFPLPDPLPLRPETGKPDPFYEVCRDPRKVTDQILRLAGVQAY